MLRFFLLLRAHCDVSDVVWGPMDPGTATGIVADDAVVAAVDGQLLPVLGMGIKALIKNIHKIPQS